MATQARCPVCSGPTDKSGPCGRDCLEAYQRHCNDHEMELARSMAIESTPEYERCTHCGKAKPHCAHCGGDFDDVSLTACLCAENRRLPVVLQGLEALGLPAMLRPAMLAMDPTELVGLYLFCIDLSNKGKNP